MKTNRCIRHHWRHPRPRGRTLRPAGKALLQVLKRQHAEPLAEFADPNGWRDWMNWLAGLPLTLDLDGLRIVHASRDAPAVEEMRAQPESVVLERFSRKGNHEDDTLGRLVNGPEARLPNGHLLATADGNATARDSRKMVEGFAALNVS